MECDCTEEDNLNMPSKTEKQRIAMAIAEHEPKKLYKRNRGLLKMSKKKLSEFARKSAKGSGEFTDSEIKQGYRRIP